MGKIKSLFFLIILSVFLLSGFACSLNNDEDLILTQEKQDEYTAYAIIDMFWFVWNQNIAGQTVGDKDFTVSGPLGGTVHVTGNTAIDQVNGINTLHLVCEYNECYGMQEVYDMHFTGTFNIDGTFSDTYKAITHTSSSVNYSGTVGPEKYVTEVSSTGSVMNFSETKTIISGTIDGRTFSWGG